MRHESIIKGQRRKASFYYDELNDLLHVYINGKSVKTLVIGDITFDVDRHGKFIGVEIINALDVLKPFSITKEMLIDIKEAEIITEPVSQNTVYVAISLHIDEQEKQAFFSVEQFIVEKEAALA